MFLRSIGANIILLLALNFVSVYGLCCVDYTLVNISFEMRAIQSQKSQCVCRTFSAIVYHLHTKLTNCKIFLKLRIIVYVEGRLFFKD